MKLSLFSTADYSSENKKTRKGPKREKSLKKQKKIVVKKCRLCQQDGLFLVQETSSLGIQEFNLCKEHYELHERKKMKFKRKDVTFEKANDIETD